MKTVVIIGAGFCGAVTAAQLLRRTREPLEVVVINRSGLMARGLAYGTRTDEHVLNVPAGRMSAFPDDETGFLRFARRVDPEVEANSFVSRRLFGDYLEWIMRETARNAPQGSRLRPWWATSNASNRARTAPQCICQGTPPARRPRGAGAG